MAFDSIDETQKIITLLRDENLLSLANNLQETLDAASTSTELLMGVRYYLSNLPRGGVISPSTLTRIQALLAEIDQILKK